LTPLLNYNNFRNYWIKIQIIIKMVTSYELVKSLEKRKIWQEYMTKNECKILKNALKSSDTFTNFMNQSKINNS